MGNSLPWKKNAVDVDALWKLQNRDQKENPLYRFVNLVKGGALVKVYENEGQTALEAYVRTHLQPYLYNEGRGGTITKLDYARWKAKFDAKLRVWTLLYIFIKLYCKLL